MNNRSVFVCALTISVASVLSAQTTTPGQIVKFRTNMGDINVQLLPESAPKTVANFMNYVNKGAYNNSVIHRLAYNFIIQGGGYALVDHALTAIPQDATVKNEYSLSNLRGTIALAKLGSDANSGTNQWFFNLSDGNSRTLNNQNEGFTVFGRITNTLGLDVMDRIAQLNIFGTTLTPELPVINFPGGVLTDDNYVVIKSIAPLGPGPAITAAGITTATAFGGYTTASAGSFIEIYGTNLSTDVSRGWSDTDFVLGKAPTTLETVSVTINGQRAFVAFVSKNQVNVQVPVAVPNVGSVPMTITVDGQVSTTIQLKLKQFAPGLLAPPAFKVGGKQYVVAVHANGTLVSNGSVSGVASAPARPGETIVFYGTGFGAVDPSSVPIAGQVVATLAEITNPLKFNIGTSAAKVAFAGLAPGLVGLYQFNVTVPTDAPNGDLLLDVAVGSEPVAQQLYLPVQAN